MSHEETRERLVRFFEDVAEVMRRHGDVARDFVLAEADPADLAEPTLAAADADGASASAKAADQVLNRNRRRVCVRFGIDPRTGRRICLQWVEMR